jgi:hypothetical protein
MPSKLLRKMSLTQIKNDSNKPKDRMWLLTGAYGVCREINK